MSSLDYKYYEKFYILLRKVTGSHFILGHFYNIEIPAGSILSYSYTSKMKLFPENGKDYVYAIDDSSYSLLYNEEYLDLIDRAIAEHLVAIIKISERLKVLKNDPGLKNAMAIKIGDCVFLDVDNKRLTGKLRYKGKSEIFRQGIGFGVELDQVT